jgi:L-asparagine transporter-like permease
MEGQTSGSTISSQGPAVLLGYAVQGTTSSRLRRSLDCTSTLAQTAVVLLPQTGFLEGDSV